jgi:hypothetical protein
MKAIFALLTFGASVAMAYPTLHDKVTLSGRYTPANGSGIDFVQTLEITGYDAAKKEYTVTATETLLGRSQTQDQKMSSDNMATPDAVKQMIASCSAIGGTPEKVTVPAFDTCAVPQSNNGKLWVGDVPFGVVKLINVDQSGNRIEAQLTNVSRGQ